MSEVQTNTKAPTMEQIRRVEAAMRAAPDADRLEIEAEHVFGPGFYARTIRIPAGCALVGKVHATEHVFILSSGELAVASADGKAVIKAPYQSVSQAGAKRVGLAVTDCVVTNVHITELTDLAALEAALIVPEALEYEAPQALGAQ